MDLLNNVNLALLDLEESSTRSFGKPPKYPFYFVVGAPRSGTTVLTQVLAHCYNFGYITNIAARFYLCPYCGVKLSQHILGKGKFIKFWSQHAKTAHPGDVHEFGYFWQNHLGMGSASDIRPLDAHSNFLYLTYNALLRLQTALDRPVVMKGIYPSYHHTMFSNLLQDKVVWINVERDPLDCCLSIFHARQIRKGGTEEWFGWYPPSDLFENVKQFRPPEQVAWQVAYFRYYYASFADYTIQLEELCRDPYMVLEDITGEEVECPLPYRALNFRSYPDNERERFREVYEVYGQSFSHASA